MIIAYFEYSTHAEIAGIYDNESQYFTALPKLEAQAESKGATLSESEEETTV